MRAFPVMTYAIVALNVAIFARELGAVDGDAFVNAFALIPFDVTHDITLAPPSPAPWLTLVSAQFLHASWPHLIGNMLVLIAAGPAMERRLGHLGFGAFYIICGVLGNLAQLVVDPGSHVPAIGASGAIAGILGAYVVTYPLARVHLPLVRLDLPIALVILAWSFVQFSHGFGTVEPDALAEHGSGIAYFAHIGGFLGGVIGIVLAGSPAGAVARRGRRTA